MLLQVNPFAPLPAAPDAERRTAAEHQQRGLGPALLFHRDAERTLLGGSRSCASRGGCRPY
jgi:hypothetical protein